MTSRERLLRTIQCKPVDRLPIRIWHFDHRQTQAEPSYERLAQIVRKYDPDLMHEWSPKITGGLDCRKETVTTPSRHEGFVEDVTTFHTPKGPLVSAHLRSLHGKPGYHSKFLLETPEDAEKWLSIPRTPPRVDASEWPAVTAHMGDSGIPMCMIGEPMYEINDLTGSEVWGYWLIEERDLIHRLVSEAQKRYLSVVQQLISAGVVGLYGSWGPELCVPPLASPKDFDDFVVRYDKPINDMIHDAGGLVWVHAHGKMRPVLERFADEGVDCLNPLEPPPMGDMTISEARQIVGTRMSFDGGLEVGDLQLKTPPEIEHMTADLIRQSQGIGLIVSFSSDLSHWPTLSDRIIENLETFLITAQREAKSVCS